MHVIKYSRVLEESGLVSGYKWLAGLVSSVCMAGLVFKVSMGVPNISGVQISRENTHTMPYHNLEK